MRIVICCDSNVDADLSECRTRGVLHPFAMFDETQPAQCEGHRETAGPQPGDSQSEKYFPADPLQRQLEPVKVRVQHDASEYFAFSDMDRTHSGE